MVERFYGPLMGFEMRPGERGDYVRYSDYAALKAQLAERVRVKPLEWTPAANDAGKDGLWFVTIDVFGKKYEVIRSYHGQKGAGWTYGDTWYGNIDEAKAAAQADYERRILSALEPAAPEGQQPVAWMDATGTELHKIIQDYQKRDMIASGGRQAERAPNYSIALFTATSEQAVTEAMVEAAANSIANIWCTGDLKAIARAALKAAMEAGR